MKYQRELEIALKAAEKTAELSLQLQQQKLNSCDKEDMSPVTIADFSCQALLCRELQQSFPKTKILAEEDSLILQKNPSLLEQIATVLKQVGIEKNEICDLIDLGAEKQNPGELYWALDPIDGTKGFIGGRQFCINIALLVDGQVELGVLAAPKFDDCGRIFYAVKGEGSFIHTSGSPVKLTVNDIADPAKAQYCQSYEKRHIPHEDHDKIIAELGMPGPALALDSQVKYMAVARGDVSLYIKKKPRPDFREKVWDHAAGTLILQEAGGKVTDFHGKPLDFSHGMEIICESIVASNGHFHDKILAAIARTIL